MCIKQYLLEGNEKLYYYPNCALHAILSVKIGCTALLRMKVGKKTSFALMVMPDIMFPEKITVGENSIIGYNTTLLAHEYLIREYRLGEIVIGNEVMIGANVTILPGVNIGDGATVSAGTLVHRDVPSGAFVGGNPMRIIYTKEQMTAREGSW